MQFNGWITALSPWAGGDESTACVCVCALVRVHVHVRGGFRRAGVCLRMFSILPWVAFSHVTVDVSWHRTRHCDSDDTGKLHKKEPPSKVKLVCSFRVFTAKANPHSSILIIKPRLTSDFFFFFLSLRFLVF